MVVGDGAGEGRGGEVAHLKKSILANGAGVAVGGPGWTGSLLRRRVVKWNERDAALLLSMLRLHGGFSLGM